MAVGSLRRFAPAWLVGAAMLVARVPTLAITPVWSTLTGAWYATLNNGAGNPARQGRTADRVAAGHSRTVAAGSAARLRASSRFFALIRPAHTTDVCRPGVRLRCPRRESPSAFMTTRNPGFRSAERRGRHAMDSRSHAHDHRSGAPGRRRWQVPPARAPSRRLALIPLLALRPLHWPKAAG